MSWSATIKLWFLGQGFHNPLEDEIRVPSNHVQWTKIDFKLCALLWQSVKPNILSTHVI